MAQDKGAPTIDPELEAFFLSIAGEAAGGGTSGQAADGTKLNVPFVPLWKKRPTSKKKERVNRGLHGGDQTSPGGGTYTTGRIEGATVEVDASTEEDYRTVDQAASAFMDMTDADREDFKRKAISAGLLKVDKGGAVSQAEVYEAWRAATLAARDYNVDRDKGQWISPWEAVDRIGLSEIAKDGGAFDPFRPQSTRTTTKRNFMEGDDAAQVTRTVESLFESEMGRAPTAQERAMYQKMVQTAYNASPEVTNRIETLGSDGNTTVNETISGGVDIPGTLLDQVRGTDERDAFQAGATFFQAAMQALGAVA